MKNIKKVTIGDKEYTFELDRKHIIKAEEVFGVSLVKIEEQVVSQSYKLWTAGLDKNHNNISVDARMDLYDEYNKETANSMEVVGFLMEIISNFLQPTLTKKQ